MILRVVVVLVLLSSGLGLQTRSAVADCAGDPSNVTQASAGLTGILISGEQESLAAMCSSTDSSSADFGGAAPPRDSDLDAKCVREAVSTDADPFQLCDLPADFGPDGPPAQVTPGLVAAAFRRLPLPASELQVQPPNGRTLVNFDTNFFTDGGELSRTVTLLGRRVELRIWPERFGWRFGDGATRWTTTPGSAYPDLEITHRYLRSGRVAPSVDTTYAAEFRVDGGPWREVAGTVTISGAAEALRVVTARPVLVGD